MADPMDLTKLTIQQTAALKELQQRFATNAESYVHDEHYLLHWLRARRFDVDKAEAMLNNHLRYRKALDMDSPDYQNFHVHPVMDQYYTRGESGYDRQGRPLVFFPFGGIDAKGIISSIRHSEGMKTIIYWLEYRRRMCEEAERMTGKHISQVVYLVDLKGVGVKHLWKPGIEMFKQILEAVQDHTPEMVYKMYILNVPSVFYTIYKMVKPILDENTQRKINICGENFKDVLLKEIDADQLPAYYGGTLVGPDGDPKCPHLITYGGDVPKELYFKDSTSPPDCDLQSTTIARGSRLVIPVIAYKPRMELKWYFKNDASNDIGFGVYRKLFDSETDVDKMEMVVPYARLFTALVPEWGEVVLKDAGAYLIVFDNSYSWIHSKTVKYRLVLEEVQHNAN